MFSVFQRTKSRSFTQKLENCQEKHSLITRIKCLCSFHPCLPRIWLMMAMNEQGRRRLCYMEPVNAQAKGCLWHLLQGPSIPMVFVTNPSTMQWVSNLKETLLPPIIPSICFNTQLGPSCGKIRFLSLFNVCFWQLQCANFYHCKKQLMSHHAISLKKEQVNECSLRDYLWLHQREAKKMLSLFYMVGLSLVSMRIEGHIWENVNAW